MPKSKPTKKQVRSMVIKEAGAFLRINSANVGQSLKPPLTDVGKKYLFHIIGKYVVEPLNGKFSLANYSKVKTIDDLVKVAQMETAAIKSGAEKRVKEPKHITSKDEIRNDTKIVLKRWLRVSVLRNNQTIKPPLSDNGKKYLIRDICVSVIKKRGAKCSDSKFSKAKTVKEYIEIVLELTSKI